MFERIAKYVFSQKFPKEITNKFAGGRSNGINEKVPIVINEEVFKNCLMKFQKQFVIGIAESIYY